MKWSCEWLKQYLKTDLTPKQIADKLTAIGLEVESIEIPILPIAAKIIECVQISFEIIEPDSDKILPRFGIVI